MLQVESPAPERMVLRGKLPEGTIEATARFSSSCQLGNSGFASSLRVTDIDTPAPTNGTTRPAAHAAATRGFREGSCRVALAHRVRSVKLSRHIAT